jgi:hypothetical protein
LPERILTPLVIAGVFVWAGSRIAPEFKIETSIVLFGVWLFLVGGFVFLTLYGANWMGGQLYFRGGGLATLMAVVGAIAGLYFVRKEQKEQSRKQYGRLKVRESNSKEQGQKSARSYTFKVNCSFQMQYTFSDDEVQIDPDGNEEDFEPTHAALATLEQEIEEHLLKLYMAEDVNVSADSNSLIGISNFKTPDEE